MTHPIPNLSTRAAQIAHYAAVKRRLYGKPVKPKPKPVLLEVVTVKHVKKSEYWDIPLWQNHRTYFNDHVIRWQMRGFSVPSDWLRDRCKELDVEHSDIVSHSRKRELSMTRQRLMVETHERFPELSLPQIGRMFGGRDHTTILHGIRVHKERVNAND